MLSLKQKRFCEEYVIFGNATEAAKKAGYSEKTAYSQGQRLLKNVETQKYIAELTTRRKNEKIASADEVLEFFAAVMRDKEEATKNRLKAAENLAKRYGLDKSPVNGEEEGNNNGVTINIKDCSKNDD